MNKTDPGVTIQNKWQRCSFSSKSPTPVGTRVLPSLACPNAYVVMVIKTYCPRTAPVTDRHGCSRNPRDTYTVTAITVDAICGCGRVPVTTDLRSLGGPHGTTNNRCLRKKTNNVRVPRFNNSNPSYVRNIRRVYVTAGAVNGRLSFIFS